MKRLLCFLHLAWSRVNYVANASFDPRGMGVALLGSPLLLDCARCLNPSVVALPARMVAASVLENPGCSRDFCSRLFDVHHI